MSPTNLDPQKIVVVTGVSSGIGGSLVRVLLARGLRVFGSVRSEEDAQRITSELGKGFTPLIMDVTSGKSVSAAAETVAEAVLPGNLHALVNNAGQAVTGPLAHLPPERLEHQLAVNVTGTLRVTQAFLPLLRKGGGAASTPGRILNISSTSDSIAFPFLGAYAASKHAVRALSAALRRELGPVEGIRVVTVRPGSVNTPIWEKPLRDPTYEDTAYGPMYRAFLDHLPAERAGGLPLEPCAERLADILAHPRPRADYTLLPPGIARRLRTWWLPRLFPAAYHDRKVAKWLRSLLP